MAGATPIRVLVVDDSEDARLLIRLVLEDERDVEVVGAADGADEALAALEHTAPDVVLMDARMPVVDGFELTPQVLARRPSARVVLLTSLVDDVIEARAAAAGAVACESKGDVDRIAHAVREAAA